MVALGGIDTRILFTALIVLVALQRLAELAVSKRNTARLLARGAREAGASHYPSMVALHTAFLIAAPLEVWLLSRPFVPALAALALALSLAAGVLRTWVIRTLAGRWTTRVIVLPGAEPVTSGPYRFLRHPNYLAVVTEIAALPLIHTAWLTALLASLGNALILRERIHVEEAALSETSNYREAFRARER
ncbi:MAG TPA: isoprenylcysteine carboxylmethyltransferase family protein [Thermoanaerobaculia bacterium]|nr:isoprenylcysteine carboxylmethyltransferase family protein [Thermoanaerobaculia bacterium]